MKKTEIVVTGGYDCDNEENYPICTFSKEEIELYSKKIDAELKTATIDLEYYQDLLNNLSDGGAGLAETTTFPHREDGYEKEMYFGKFHQCQKKLSLLMLEKNKIRKNELHNLCDICGNPISVERFIWLLGMDGSNVCKDCACENDIIGDHQINSIVDAEVATVSKGYAFLIFGEEKLVRVINGKQITARPKGFSRINGYQPQIGETIPAVIKNIDKRKIFLEMLPAFQISE